MANSPADIGAVDARAAGKKDGSYEKLKLSSHLAILRDDPDDTGTCEALKTLVRQGDVARLGAEPLRAIQTARLLHEQRGETRAVAHLTEAEALLLRDDPARAAGAYKELGRLRGDELLDPEGARAAYQTALQLAPGDAELSDACKRLEQTEKSWRKFAKRYIDEAREASDVGLRTTLLLRAASLVWQYKKRRDDEPDALFREALAADPGNRRAVMLYEQVLRQGNHHAALAELLLEAASRARDKHDQLNFRTRAARTFARRLGDAERAADGYQSVLATEPGNAEALAFMSKHLTKQALWDDLIAMYDRALAVRQDLDLELQAGILLQAGMVHWRMRGNTAAAESYFGRLRKLDPANRSAIDFYREHYAGSERVEAWLSVLGDACRVSRDDAQRIELAQSLAEAAQLQPQLRDRAIEAWKLVQRLDPDNRRALAELKSLYAQSQKWNALADTIKTEIETTAEAQVDERIALLYELLAVYRDRLHMDGMVTGTLSRIAKLRPSDLDALAELTLKYEAAGRYNDLINVLSEHAEGLRDPGQRVISYLRIARLWIDHFTNYSQATSPLEKALQLEPDNHEVLALLKNIYAKKRAWKQLYEVLRREKSASRDPAVILANCVEMARLAADRLQGYGDAIALWKEALALDPQLPHAIEALEKLADGEGDHATLIEVRELELAQADDDETRIRVLQKLALLYGERLLQPEQAIVCWRRILTLDPRHGRATRAVRDGLLKTSDWDGLSAHYASVGDFESLVDVLSHESDRAADPALKIALSFRVAGIFEQHIRDPNRALRSYERVLSADPSNARAAAKLAIIYEADGKWTRLRGMLDILLRAASDDEQRLALLTRLRALCMGQLRDGDAAFAYASAAYALFAEREEVRRLLEESAEAASGFERLIELYLLRAEVAPAPEALELRRRVAKIAQERLGQDAVAAAQLREVLQAAPTDSAVMDSLERIYRVSGRTAELSELLLHRVNHGASEDQHIRALKELAHLAESVFSDAEAAAVHYRALSKLEPKDRDVLLARDRLALGAGRWDELSEVLEKRLAIEDEPGARIELATRLGMLWAERLGKPERALDAFEAVIEHQLLSGSALEALEHIAEQQPPLRTRASQLLTQVYEQSGRHEKLRKVLLRRLETEKDEEIVHRLRLQVAEISSVHLGDLAAAYGALESAFLEQPDDRELWERLREVAERSGQQHALATAYATAALAGELADDDRLELARRTARLYEVLEQPDEAEAFHREVLRLDPLDDPAFKALKQLYTGKERWEDLQLLHRKRIEDSTDVGDRLELQLALCFLFEEVLGRPLDAIASYQQVLALVPNHIAARRMLERLYEQTERWRDLAELLADNLATMQGPERVETMWRIGQLHECRLGEPGTAVEQYQAILGVQPHHVRAQQALSGLLGVADQRQRIAAFLEPLYQSQGAYRDLGRVLEIQLDDRNDDRSAAELLLRLGELHEHRTRDPEAAFSAYARAVEKQPDNESARHALARIASSRESFRRQRAQVLERVLERLCDAPELQADLLFELAVLLDEFLGEKDAAERAYEQLIEIEPDNAERVLAAARALEPIHAARQDFARLAIDLQRQVQFESDPVARERLLVRLANLHENSLSAPQRAIDAHRLRLELDPESEDTLRALERLYERSERWNDLCEVLEMHRRVTTDEQERRSLGRRAAALREDRLDDRDGAISAYDALLTELGPDKETLRALAAVYERAERHADLLDTLQYEEQWIDDPHERAALQFRMAELMRLHTGELSHALELYDAVLNVDPEHAGSLAALGSVMNDPTAGLRSYAARLLAPRYRKSGAHQLQLSALEVLQDTDDLFDKLAALRAAAELTERELQNPAVAFTYVARAARAAVDDAQLPELLRELARLAEVSAQQAEHAAILSEIAPLIGDGQLRAQLHRQVARIARTQLNDPQLAAEHYGKLLEDLPKDEEAFDALERISQDAGDDRGLIAVLERKAELASDLATRRALRARQAELLEQRLAEPGLAIDILQELTLEAPSEASCAALARLLTSLSRWDELRALYERQLALHIGSAVELRYALAEVSLQRLGDSAGALLHLRDAIIDDNEHEPSIALLENLMDGDTEQRSAAAEALEPIYLGRMQWPKLTASLEARIKDEQDLEERKRLLTRLGQIYEDQLEDYDGAISAYARLFREDPRDEDTWETLARLCRMAGQWKQLGEILAQPIDEEVLLDETLARLAKYAGRIHADRLGDHRQAARLLEKALAFDPGDGQVFAALEAAYIRTGAHEQLLRLYREQADVTNSDERRAKLLSERARLFREVLGKPAEGIASYREILEIDPDNAAAIGGLQALLVQTEDWPELAEHLRARIERAADPSEQTALKNRLAGLLETRLADTHAAIDLYEEVARAAPDDPQMLEALERLAPVPEHTLHITRILDPVYRQLDQWKKLIAVLEAQAELVDDDFERLRLLSEIGVLHEQRGADRRLSLHAWSRAFACDPSQPRARDEVDRLATHDAAWEELVLAYEAALPRVEDAQLVTGLLTTLARVHDEKRGDLRAAIAVYERLTAHEPSDPVPLDSLEALHTMMGDWPGLAGVLGRKIERAYEAQERAEMLRRLGSVHEELLGDPLAAIAAYDRALGEDPGDSLALEALDRLYEAQRKPEDLAEVLARRIELCLNPQKRVELGLRLGTVYDQLHQAELAIASYSGVLDDDPACEPALDALASAFARQGMWSELLENLERRQRLAPLCERAEFAYRAGALLQEHLGDEAQALERYREALDLDPAHAASIAALLRAAPAHEHGARAAEIVEPRLASQARWDDLAVLIESGLPRILDPIARRMQLQRLARLHEGSRGNASDAFHALGRALAEDPGDEALLADLERLAQQSASFPELAKLLANQAEQSPDGAVAAELYRRLARIYEDELREDERAIAALEHASQRDERIETLVALDRLYERTGRWKGLLSVLERRVGSSADPAARVDLLIRLGELRDQRLGDGRGALVAFEEVLEGDPGEARALAGMERLARYDAIAPDVLAILDRCYQHGGAAEKLADLYEIRIRLAGSDADRIRLLEEVARIWRDDLKQPARALAQVRRAFELDPSRNQAIAELESLADAGSDFEGLRGMVEGLIESGAVEGQTKLRLALRAAGWYRDRIPDRDCEERCLRWALEVDAGDADIHQRLVALLRGRAREGDLVEALREQAEAQADPATRKPLLLEAARIAEQTLGRPEIAQSCYDAVLDCDPEDREALFELARLRGAGGDFGRVVALLGRALELERDPQLRAGLRLRMAQTLERDLRDPDQAITAYRSVLEDLPHHEPALEALERLYQATGRSEELMSALEGRRDRAPAGQRLQLRLQLAGIAEQRLARPERAIRELVELLDEQPDASEAQDELQRLYADGEHWAELVELMQRRAAQAAARGDTGEELEWLRKVASSCETKLENRAMAIESYARISEREPGDQTALEALVRLHLADQQWAAAAGAMQALLALRSGAGAVLLALQLAEVAEQRLSNLELAEAALLAALRADPEHRESQQRLLDLYTKHQVSDRLVALLAAAEQRTTDPAEKLALLRRIASVYRDALHDPARTIAALERAAGIAPDDRELLLLLCDAYLAADRSTEAIPLLQKVIDSYGPRRVKEVALYQHRLGRAYEKLGQLDEAVRRYDAAFRIDLTSVPILHDLGRASLAKGDLERAQKTYRALLLQKLGPEAGLSKADVYYHLGEIAFRLADPLKARAMLERAIAESGGHAAAQTLLDRLPR